MIATNTYDWATTVNNTTFNNNTWTTDTSAMNIVIKNLTSSWNQISIQANQTARAMTGLVTPSDRQPPLTFNPYINASDLLEEFIRYAGSEGVRQGEVFDLPIELFIKWLIVKACEQDQEEPDVVVELPVRSQPRCLGCNRWMKRETKLQLHGSVCADWYFKRASIAA